MASRSLLHIFENQPNTSPMWSQTSNTQCINLFRGCILTRLSELLIYPWSRPPRQRQSALLPNIFSDHAYKTSPADTMPGNVAMLVHWAGYIHLRSRLQGTQRQSIDSHCCLVVRSYSQSVELILQYNYIRKADKQRKCNLKKVLKLETESYWSYQDVSSPHYGPKLHTMVARILVKRGSKHHFIGQNLHEKHFFQW
jgi:hypothetical protein